jgi:hypothetical protein
MGAYANDVDTTMSLSVENSTRATDSSKHRPHRLRFDRAREVSPDPSTPLVVSGAAMDRRLLKEKV